MYLNLRENRVETQDYLPWVAYQFLALGLHEVVLLLITSHILILLQVALFGSIVIGDLNRGHPR